MEKIAVIYWSQSGNTEMMANAVAEGAREAGAEVVLTHLSDTSAADAAKYGKLALGCPAMGAEVRLGGRPVDARLVQTHGRRWRKCPR